MSWLSDSTSLRSGAWVSSAYPGLGVRGDAVPSTGLHGASILYPGLNLPTEAADEFIGLILTTPGGLTFLLIDEDGSIQAEGPNGTYSGTYQGFKNGVSYGTNTYTLQIGVGVASGDAQLGDVAAGGGAGGGSPSGASGGAQLGDVAAAGGASANSGLASGGAQLDDVAAGGGASSLPSGTAGGNANLDDVQAAGGAGSQPSGASGGAQLDDMAAGGGASANSGTAAGGAQLDDVAAGGGASSLPSGSAGGNATLDDVQAAGGASTPSGSASGGAQLDDVAAGGGAGAGQPSIASGDAQLQDGAASGGAQGFEEPVAVIGTRFVEVGFSKTPKHLDPLDVSEVDDIAFRFGKLVRQGETLLGFTSTCQRRVGVDPAPDPLRVGGPQKMGTDAVQRVDGTRGVVGVTYLIRVVATMNNGRTEVGTAFIKVVRRS